MTPRFEAFACIDWSGAAVARPPGLAVGWCEAGGSSPVLLRPAGGWSRAALLDWLIDLSTRKVGVLVGMDLSPALPFVDCGAYFPGNPASPTDARALWAMVDTACAAEPHLAASSLPLRPDLAPHFRNHRTTGALYPPGAGRMRLVEHRQRLAGVNPVSCFNLVGAAQVGKSSLTGMRVLHRLQGRVPVWPFDALPAAGPVIVEIYTAIAARQAGLRRGISKVRDGETLDACLAALGSAPHARLDRYDDHSTDALLTAAWLRQASTRADLWMPDGLGAVAQTEGWTFGAV